MAQFSIFGGHTGRLDAGAVVHFTLFGGADIRRSPAARLVVEQRSLGMAPRRQVFITVFGGTNLQWPTLAHEYLALRDALRAQELTLADWDRLVGQVAASPNVVTFTLFGGFEANAVPGEDRELEDLALQRHFGQIPDEAMKMLMLGVGQRGPERLAAVRQAIVAVLTAPASERLG